MAKANLLNTSTSTFLELIGNGRTYKAPPYQRDYSWTEEQWEDLWTDLVELVERPDDSHYMGALVVEGKSDREFAVIDGQQRIATISLLTLAVIQRLLALADAGVDAENNRQRAAALRARFIGEKDPASLVEASKLTLNDTDNAFYQDYLVQLRAPLNPRGLPKSNRLLWECLGYFSRQVEAWSAHDPDGARIARLVSEAAGRQLMFIRIAVDDELNAYTVFETLNARGLELSATDLLKNYLFSRLRTAADLQALQRRWSALMAVEERLRTPADVFATLRHLYVDDKRFEQDFARLAPDPAGQGRKLVRYILAALESDASGRACDPDADPGTVEHVLPENPSAAWEADFPRQLWERSIDRLGNLTWLEPSLNRRVANADFATKCQTYRSSRYMLTSSLPDSVGTEWTPARLDARQSHLARRAVHLWRADFDSTLI